MGSRQLLVLLLQLTGSFSIFHRWYIPHSKAFSRGKYSGGGVHSPGGGVHSPGGGVHSPGGWLNSAHHKRGAVGGFNSQTDHIIKECMTVSHSEGGRFRYEGGREDQVCGLYLVGRPDERIVLTLDAVDINGACDHNQIVLVDGWELNGNVIPSPQDHLLTLDQRMKSVCEEGGQIQLVSSQNAAMVQYKIGTPGLGFSVSVKYIDNPEPCNVLMSDMTGVFQISNHGQHRNCSVTTLLFPAKVSLLEVNVGSRLRKKREVEQKRSSGRARRGLFYDVPSPQCSELGEVDFLELGGSGELDSSNLEARSTLCGGRSEDSLEKDLTILCGSSTLRLVSSGEFRNSVTALVTAATAEDLDANTNTILACPQFL